MSAQDRFRRVDALFRTASAMPAEQRDAYLASQCVGETSILEQVRSLIDADRRDVGVLDRPAIVSASVALEPDEPLTQRVPPHIGRFRVLRQLGEGGMGVVYEAEQENPRRRVALKMLRRSAASRRVLQRFQQEAQILGRLQHVAIAQVLEAGVAGDGPDACPFFAMELVEGPSLLAYAQGRGLNTRERLELFARTCDAVQYAHQSGVIHRDLKPANILVVEPGQPKILDFGIARLTDADLSAVTQQTTTGELIGTVPYMSPEQAAGDPLQLDWRSDVYSLGVILYELLTGRLPHDVRRLMVHEAVRAIREDEPTPAGSIDRTLRGDVEVILARALEKDKHRRYQSAAALADDIRRYLGEQPIHARPASAVYRFSKFARRNKAIVSGVAVAFAALAVGAGIAVRLAVIAEAARADERRQRDAAEHQTYRACMLAASSALRRHEIAEARRHLDAAPEPLREWEWAHLESRLDDGLERWTSGGFNPTALAVHPFDGSVAASSSAGRIWTWNADRSVRGVYARVGSVRERRFGRLTYSADGALLRADATTGSVWLDAQTLAPIRVDERSVACRSPDGRIALCVPAERNPAYTLVEEYESRRELFRIPLPPTGDDLSRFSRDGGLLALFAPRGGGLHVFRCPEGALVARRDDVESVSDMCFDHAATRLAIATAGGEALILDAATGRTIATLRGHGGSVNGIDFSPDGRRIVTASSDGTVRLWRSNGSPLVVMHGGNPRVFGAVFVPDGRAIITAMSGGELCAWDALADSDPFVLPASGSIYGLCISPDGARLAAASLGGDRPLRIWDASSGHESFAGLTGGFLSALSFDRTGTRLIVGQSNRGATTVVNLHGETLGSVAGHDWRTDWVHLDESRDLLISLGNSGQLRTTDLATRRTVRRHALPANDEAHGCRAAMSPDGALLAVASRTTLRLLDREWNTVAELTGHTGDIYALAFSADSERLISGSRDRTLRVWDVRKPRQIAELTGHTDEVFAAAFSPDGKRIVSGGRDRVIRVWDAQRYEELTQLHGHTSYVYCLAFSPNGRLLASGGGDDCVRLWDTRPYREWIERRNAEPVDDAQHQPAAEPPAGSADRSGE